MTDFEAIQVVEGFEPSRDREHAIAAWQHLINTGLLGSCNAGLAVKRGL